MIRTSDTSARPRSLGVDFLRAVCILYVVGYWHLMRYTTDFPGYANWLTEGLKFVALSTFVFCSGFLLARQPVTLDPAGLWRFYRRRLVRIYPLYVVTLFLFIPAGMADLQQVIKGVFLISMFSPPAMWTLWFITMIMVFYLIAPFLIRFADQYGPTLLIGLAMALALVADHLLIHPIDLRILIYLPVFVFGVLYQRQPGLRAWIERFQWPLLALELLMLPLSHVGSEASLAGALILIPLVLVSAAVTMVFSDRIASRLHRPTISYLAYASFGLYLMHRLVMQVLVALYFPANGWGQVAYLLALAVPLSILAGYWVQRGYDRLLSTLVPD